MPGKRAIIGEQIKASITHQMAIAHHAKHSFDHGEI
ncbi:hypothetical protein AmaxDRAFT_4377 [Limnospira maxima CS-328]|uniref:Uncharacterized protein n=1 Tax=Limnospira maxima CS-328 TaxID=513049 RepID=B5W6H8_LIMMA|nr:hypothetical protein AmaxDRAFT_4377 [Limnospira maxima CS-328]